MVVVPPVGTVTAWSGYSIRVLVPLPGYRYMWEYPSPDSRWNWLIIKRER